jgi:hypothetical protein
LLHELNLEVSGDVSWQPCGRQELLTASELADQTIAANIHAIGDTFEHINFVARTEDDICIGYWRALTEHPLRNSPLVSYDSERTVSSVRRFDSLSHFSSCSPTRRLSTSFREACCEFGIVISFESLDDITIPRVDPTPMPSIWHATIHTDVPNRYSQSRERF